MVASPEVGEVVAPWSPCPGRVFFSSTKFPTCARFAERGLRAHVGERADTRPGLDHRLAQQAVIEDLGAGADLDVHEPDVRAHHGARAHDRSTLEDRVGSQHRARLDDDIGAHERARRVFDAHALRREVLRSAHESVGATSAWNSAPRPQRREVVVTAHLRAARGAGVDGGLERLECCRGVTRSGLRGGGGRERSRSRVDLQGLLEVADGLGVVAAVVEDDPVVEELFEGLRPRWPLGAIAHDPVGAGPLDQLLLVSMALQ